MTSLDIRFGFVFFTALNWFCMGANLGFGLLPHAIVNTLVAMGGMWALKRVPELERCL